MAKCRTLQEENEEIGNQASEGKVLPSLLMPLIVTFPLICVVLVTGSNVTLACIPSFVFIFLFYFPLGMQMHELGMKLALQKSQNSQLRSQFEGL